MSVGWGNSAKYGPWTSAAGISPFVGGSSAVGSRARHFQRPTRKSAALEYPLPRPSPRRAVTSTEFRAPAPEAGWLRAPILACFGKMLASNLLLISAGLFMLGAVGWCWRHLQSIPRSGSERAAGNRLHDVGRGRCGRRQIRLVRHIEPCAGRPPADRAPGPESRPTRRPASLVAREWSRLQQNLQDRRPRSAPTVKARESSHSKREAAGAARFARGRGCAAFGAASADRSNSVAHPAGNRSRDQPGRFRNGAVSVSRRGPGSSRPFLNAGQDGRRGHVNFRGHVYWESPTFSDDHVLLHIPPGFDPSTSRRHGGVLPRPRRDARPRRARPAAGPGADHRGRRQCRAGRAAIRRRCRRIRAPASSGSRTASSASSTKRRVKLARLYGDPRRADDVRQYADRAGRL